MTSGCQITFLKSVFILLSHILLTLMPTLLLTLIVISDYHLKDKVRIDNLNDPNKYILFSALKEEGISYTKTK